MLRRTLQPFHPRSQPWITRQSYAHELVNVTTFSVAIALVEGGVVSVLAKKAFDVGPALFATIMAAPMFANLTSFVWAYLARGRRKVRTINLLQVALLVVIGSIALLPTAWPGALLLTALIVVARCLIAGIVTLRSTVWRMNYPRRFRAQVTGRLALINSLVIAGTPLLGYGLLDLNPELFRLIYPASIAVATFGVAAFAKVRLRGERELLRYEALPTARPQPHGLPGPIYEYDPRHADTPTRANFWTVLREDRFFRLYMLWQFVAGASNMMGEAVIIYLIADLTAGQPAEYLTSIALSTAIPMALATITLPRWARLLDRIHVAEFRAHQGLLWIAGQSSNWIGALLALHWSGSFAVALGVLTVARVLQGIARGAGMLAWNLGHNDFADRRLVAVYMGIHVTLTGIRGAVAPFLGMALYAGWSDLALPGTGLALPGFEGIGYHVFLITTALAVVSEVGFKILHRSIRTARGEALPAD